MEAVLEIHPGIWVAVHLAGIVLAVSSRSHLGPVCTFCTSFLLMLSMALVGMVAAVSFLAQQPFWAASGCTLGMMAVVMCLERTGYEPNRLLQAISRCEDQA